MSTAFTDLVKLACQAEQTLRDHSADARMSAEALVEGCLHHVNSDHHRLQALRETLQARGSSMRSTQAFISQVSRLAAEGRVSNGIPQGIERMSLPSRDEARAELSEVGYSLWEAWALGLQQAAKHYPRAFGNVTDAIAWHHRLDELRAKRTELYEQISTAWVADDLVISDVKEDRARVTMRLAPEVPLGPVDTLGERLVSYLLEIDPQKWGAEPPKSQAKELSKKVAA